jgi:hypothetical protein
MTYGDKIRVLRKRYGCSRDQAKVKLNSDHLLMQARTLTEFNSCLDELPFHK